MHLEGINVMAIRIMIVEDEKKMRILLRDYLKREGYEVIEAENGRQALKVFEESQPDLMILDIMMPELDGWTVCREIRKESHVPIIMLTAKSQDSDELLGFELGADEYITKPFKPGILVARIKAIVKRTLSRNEEESIMTFPGLTIDQGAYKVKKDNVLMDLSPKEYELLIYMIENKGLALSRDQILNGVWGYDYYGDERTVDTHVKRLRVKLDNKSNYIQTVRGVGYRFEVEE